MVMMMIVGTLEYISGQRGHWFDGMMVSDNEGVWLMKPPHSQHGNKVTSSGIVYDVTCIPIATIWSNHVLDVST